MPATPASAPLLAPPASAGPPASPGVGGGAISLPFTALALAWAALGWSLLTATDRGSAAQMASWLPELLLPWIDKLGHFGLFLVQALLLERALHRRLGTTRALLVGLLFALLWGGAAELRQRTLPGRSAELADLLADVAGAGAYAGTRRLAGRRR